MGRAELARIPVQSWAVGIRPKSSFTCLLMPDGASVPLEAAATDSDLRALKGKVEMEAHESDQFGTTARSDKGEPQGSARCWLAVAWAKL